MAILVPKTSDIKEGEVHNSSSTSSSSSSSHVVTPFSSVDEAVIPLKQRKKRGCWATLMTGDGYMPGLA